MYRLQFMPLIDIEYDVRPVPECDPDRLGIVLEAVDLAPPSKHAYGSRRPRWHWDFLSVFENTLSHDSQ